MHLILSIAFFKLLVYTEKIDKRIDKRIVPQFPTHKINKKGGTTITMHDT